MSAVTRSAPKIRVEVEPEDYKYFYHSYPATSLNDRFRNEFRVNTTIFVDNAVGSHEVKVGAEYSDMKFDNAFWYNGGAYIRDQLEVESPSYQFQDINGDGYYNAWMTLKEPLDEAEDITTSTGDILTFFAQDAWRPHPNVTVKPGVRWDNVKLGNHTGEQIADMDSWQPRFGIAWDIAGNSKYVLRASGGRFMDPTALSIPNFASGVVQTYHDYNTMEFYCNATRGLRCDPGGFPGELRRSDLLHQRRGHRVRALRQPGQSRRSTSRPRPSTRPASATSRRPTPMSSSSPSRPRSHARPPSRSPTSTRRPTTSSRTRAPTTPGRGATAKPRAWTTRPPGPRAPGCTLLHDHQLQRLLPQVRRHHPAGRDPAQPAPPARQLHLLGVQGQHRQRRPAVLCDGPGRLLPGSLLQPRRLSPGRPPPPAQGQRLLSLPAQLDGGLRRFLRIGGSPVGVLDLCKPHRLAWTTTLT